MRLGANPAALGAGTGGARMTALASMPATWLTPDSRWGADVNSSDRARAPASPRRGAMSLNTMPGSGKSGTSLISDRKWSIVGL